MNHLEKVWFITGASSGFGKELTLNLVAKGYSVVATARNPDDIRAYLPHDTQALILPLDVTKQEEITIAVKQAVEFFGKIDVLVNNAGIGYFSAIEDANIEDVKSMFAVNFWGLVEVTNSILPQMRKRQSGHIMNISSLGGLRAFAGFGFYHASKFALEGYSESLFYETLPLGISVTLVEPGDFTTDFAGRSALESTTKLTDYDQTAGKNIRGLRQLNGHQPGNPDLAAKAMISMFESDLHPPLRLLLGSDAYQRALEKLTLMEADFNNWKNLTLSTDHPQSGEPT